MKRYALEGNEVMTAVIDAVFQRAVENGITHVVIGMPHRGRLNFLQGLNKRPIFYILSLKYPNGASFVTPHLHIYIISEMIFFFN